MLRYRDEVSITFGCLNNALKTFVSIFYILTQHIKCIYFKMWYAFIFICDLTLTNTNSLYPIKSLSLSVNEKRVIPG